MFLSCCVNKFFPQYVEIDDEGYIDVDGYLNELSKENISDTEKLQVKAQLDRLQGDINRVINSVEQDNWVQFCVHGRQVDGVTDMFDNKVRFPKLANTIRKQIATGALNQAKNNYYAKYDQLTDRMQQDLVKISERLAAIEDLNQQDVRIAIARDACVNMAALSAFAKAPVGQSLWAKIIVGIIVIAAIVVASIFTFGGVATAFAVATLAGTISISMTAATVISAAVGATVGIAAGVMVGALDSMDKKNYEQELRNQELNRIQTQNHGEYYANEWNYMEKITTDFDEKTMTCKKCISHRQCKKTSWHLFSDRACSKWETSDFVDERCSEVQF